MNILATLIVFLPLPLAAQDDTTWSELQRDLNTKLDRSLETLAGFAQLDARFHAEAANSPSQIQAIEPSYKAAMHPVHQFMGFFSGPARSFYSESFERLEKYRAMISEVFGREGVPADLIWIGLIESGYNSQARSPRDAVGMWQLTRETATAYGLIVRRGIDERTDAAKSTVAAARFLRHLYSVFQDWNLVLAAYNSGEDRVLKAIARTATHDFWDLARNNLLPQETRDYVPAVLAAIELERTWTVQPSKRLD
jgi:membrane-bound lytic murein transglycosylase D